MPRLNGTGPQGAGPMTGRGMGNCNSANTNANLYGRGMGMGRGRGRGFNCGRGYGYGFNAYNSAPQMTPEQQKEILKQQKDFLANELKNIDEQIEKL